VGGKTDTIQKNTEALIDANMEDGLQVNPEKTRYTMMSRYKKTEQRHSIKIINRSFEDVAKFKHSEIKTACMKRLKEDYILEWFLPFTSQFFFLLRTV
jgi:hypothetical protein